MPSAIFFKQKIENCLMFWRGALNLCQFDVQEASQECNVTSNNVDLRFFEFDVQV